MGHSCWPREQALIHDTFCLKLEKLCLNDPLEHLSTGGKVLYSRQSAGMPLEGRRGPSGRSWRVRPQGFHAPDRSPWGPTRLTSGGAGTEAPVRDGGGVTGGTHARDPLSSPLRAMTACRRLPGSVGQQRPLQSCEAPPTPTTLGARCPPPPPHWVPGAPHPHHTGCQVPPDPGEQAPLPKARAAGTPLSQPPGAAARGNRQVAPAGAERSWWPRGAQNLSSCFTSAQGLYWGGVY